MKSDDYFFQIFPNGIFIHPLVVGAVGLDQIYILHHQNFGDEITYLN